MGAGNCLVKPKQLLHSAGTIERLVAAGGVCPISYLRQQLLDYGRQRHIEIITAPPQFSCDNASGVGLLGSLEK